MRRKTLLNNLISGMALDRESAQACLESAGISATARAEALSIEELGALANAIADRT